MKLTKILKYILNENVKNQYKFKYFVTENYQEDLYDIVKKIDDQIADILEYPSRQTSGLFKFIKDNKITDNINIRFTEEIKDGRSSKFNISLPLKLKGKILGSDSFKFKIENIKFDYQYNQESDYNEYVDYIYNVSIRRIQ